MTKSKPFRSRRWSSAVRFIAGFTLVVSAISLMGCKAGSNKSATNSAAQPGEEGVEKAKPAPGTGNVQGKVFFNSKPVENIEVKLCEKFSQYLSGCGGRILTARTDKDGE
jgi:hypothetical protein